MYPDPKMTGTGSLVYITPRGWLGQQNTADAMNRICPVVHQKRRDYTHGRGRQKYSSVTVARACKDMRASAEAFITYGPKDKIGVFDDCDCRCHSCGLGSG